MHRLRVWLDEPSNDLSVPLEVRAQATFIGWLILCAVPITMLSSIAAFARGDLIEGAAGSTGGLCCIGAMFAMRTRRSFVSFPHLIGVMQLVLHGATVLSSRETTNLVWLAILPLIILFFAGTGPALLWAGIGTAAMGALTFELSRGLDAHQTNRLMAIIFKNWAIMPVVLGLGVTFKSVQDRAQAALKEARDSAQSANRAKTSFLASISHEIRTPLNGVLGTAELLLLKTQLDASTREDVRTIQGSGTLLLRLLNDLLDLSKVEAGHLEITALDFEVEPITGEVIALYRALAAELKLALDFTSTLPPSLVVSGDSVRVRQVLNNLVGNALKFTEHGKVELRSSGERDAQGRWALRFEVQDTGRGISPNDLERVFEPFTQLNRTDAQSGTGLGLPLSRTLARAMGGDLVAFGSPEGSCFVFTLSLQESTSTEVPAPTRSPLEPALPGRALVVDDNAINLRVATAMIKRLGYEVETATDGNKALEALARGGWALVLMDCHMPVMGGLEATRRHRAFEQHSQSSRTPIVALTASVLAAEVAECRAPGMDACLSKPLQLAELEAIVEKLSADLHRVTEPLS